MLGQAGLATTWIVVPLLLGECAIRVLGLAPQIVQVQKGRYRLSTNPEIGYEPVPGMQYEGRSLHFYDYRGKSNSLGFRDYEHERTKKPGAFRIAVIGDSIAAGHTVHNTEETFPVLVESKLRASNAGVEVLNFGVSGYNTQQEVETLKERGLAFSPDLVLVSYNLNDRVRTDGGILSTLLAEARGSPGFLAEDSWLANSALFRFVWFRVLKKHERPGTYDALGEDTVAASMAELAQLAEAHDFSVAIAVFPDFRDLETYRFQDQHEFIADIGKRHGFEMIDLLEGFSQCGEGLSDDHYHPNTRGHACAADLISRALTQLVMQVASPSSS